MRAVELQRLNGWLTLLDDPSSIDHAQQVLRLPVHRLPVPPVAMPETRAHPWSDDVAPAVAAPSAEEAAAELAAPVVERAAPRGAYARRAARKGGGHG